MPPAPRPLRHRGFLAGAALVALFAAASLLAPVLAPEDPHAVAGGGGATLEGPSVSHPRGPGARRRPPRDHAPSPSAERRRPAARGGDDRRRRQHGGRGRALLPRSRRAVADDLVGGDARRRPDVPRDRPLGGRLPRGGPPPGRTWRQPAR